MKFSYYGKSWIHQELSFLIYNVLFELFMISIINIESYLKFNANIISYNPGSKSKNQSKTNSGTWNFHSTVLTHQL